MKVGEVMEGVRKVGVMEGGGKVGALEEEACLAVG
jgi:hypothetical protein